MGKALTEPDHVPSSFQATVNNVAAPPAARRSWSGYALPSPSLPICPSHILTMVGATLQSVLPPEYADASFHAGPEREGPLEPGLFFVLLALLSETTALRQGHAPDARSLGDLLALFRVEPAVASQELRRTSEALAVPLYALGQVRVLAAGFFEHLIAAYDAAFDLVE